MKTITESDRLKLIGLLALAAHHNRAIEDIRRALYEITAEEPDGHTSDTLYSVGTSFGQGPKDPADAADDLLKLLKITVEAT